MSFTVDPAIGPDRAVLVQDGKVVGSIENIGDDTLDALPLNRRPLRTYFKTDAMPPGDPRRGGVF